MNMLPEPGQKSQGKLVTGHQGLVEAGISAAHHHLGVKAGGQLTDQISMGGPVNTKTDSDGNIPGRIEPLAIFRVKIPQA